ncbi:hypothetical protein PoB_001844100 [Plakobranchus ocellatus]|uniref:Myb/SANT-like DNA-binding domain-containing protein n=1 Tax=Plakobranchus ocellatus TaxID=259542 RepID=A0AAV3Z7T2_9GAST|nr:hypothetical protein PoB_001844100 [Plakobranchus ocellatus]
MEQATLPQSPERAMLPPSSGQVIAVQEKDLTPPSLFCAYLFKSRILHIINYRVFKTTEVQPEPSGIRKPQKPSFLQSTFRSMWTEELTKTFIMIVDEKRELFFDNTKKRREVWREVANALADATGCQVPAEACDNKWRHLKSRYKEITDTHRKTGRGTVKWAHFKSMQQACREDASIVPPCLISAGAAFSTIIRPNLETKQSVESQERVERQSHIQETPERRKRKNKDDPPPWLQTVVEEQRVGQEALRDILKNQLEVEERKAAALEKFVDFMTQRM